MNIIVRPIAQPTREQFDFNACCRWDEDGGLQRPPFDRGIPPENLNGWPLRIGVIGIWERLKASGTHLLDWLVSSDGRLARDIRELFGVPCMKRIPSNILANREIDVQTGG